MKATPKGSKPPSQRQMKVGEEIRHIISEIIIHGELHNLIIESATVSISEVRVSPDLKNATVYFTTLTGKMVQEVNNALKDAAPYIRGLLSKKARIRYTPRLTFVYDTSFDTANHINELLNQEAVKKDILPS